MSVASSSYGGAERVVVKYVVTCFVVDLYFLPQESEIRDETCGDILDDNDTLEAIQVLTSTSGCQEVAAGGYFPYVVQCIKVLGSWDKLQLYPP